MSVTAADAIEVIGTSADDQFGSGLSAQVNPGAAGDAGDLTIATGRLLVRDGAFVSASTFGTGAGGTLSVTASDVIELIGTSADGQYFSGLTAVTQGDGDAGDLTIETGRLIVQDGAEVTVSSQGLGDAGNLEVVADSIRLDNQAALNSNTTGGQGNIFLRSGDLVLRRGSNITTNATGTASGGNITIDTDFIAASENSDISANAREAFGGQVIINAQGIFGTEFRQVESLESDITATSALGPQFSGTVQINTPDVDPSRGLVTLSTSLIDASGLIAQSCLGSGRATASEQSQFIVTGRGGLPPSPSEALSSQAVWQDLRPPVRQVAHRSDEVRPSNLEVKLAPRLFSPIVEAQGWVTNNKGEVVLTAQAPTVTLHIPWLPSTDCHAPKTSS